MDSLKTLHPFQIILMSVFAMFALVGLIFFANSKGLSSNASAVGSVVIWGTLPSDAITKELQAISTVDKSYSKVTYVQQQPATFDSQLANAIASGNGPDLIIINQEQILNESSKLNIIPFSSISQRAFSSTYLPEDQLFLTTTGTYGIPFVLDPLVLYYNQNILIQAGIPTPPGTWEAVTGMVPALTHNTLNTAAAQSGIALGTYNNIENARGILSVLFMQAGSPITQSSNLGVRSVLSNAANSTTYTGVSPVAAALNFYTQFSDPSRTVYTWNSGNSSAKQAFLAGELALYVGYASEEPQIKAGNPNLSFDMAQIPQLQTSTSKADYGLAYAFAVPKASHNAKGAFLAATALTGISYLPNVAQSLSMAPANRMLLTPPANDLYAAIYYPDALIANGWLSPDSVTTDSIFSAMITNISTGKYQSADAVNITDQALDTALQSYQ
jgi:ABC-type glycerol-3-phosphate transport system substrate-binding protein